MRIWSILQQILYTPVNAKFLFQSNADMVRLIFFNSRVDKWKKGNNLTLESDDDDDNDDDIDMCIMGCKIDIYYNR